MIIFRPVRARKGLDSVGFRDGAATLAFPVDPEGGDLMEPLPFSSLLGVLIILALEPSNRVAFALASHKPAPKPSNVPLWADIGRWGKGT